MKRLFVFAVLGLMAISAFAQTDPFAPFRVFEGHWQGSSAGKPGTGTTTREYRFTLNNHFLWQHDKSVYQTTDGKTFVHEDEGYFSYDKSRKLILWDQFHSEGLVNEYALDSISDDGKSITLITTQIENFPGARARKLYRIVSPDAIDETFWVAPPGQDYAVYTVAHLQRVK
jgi:hypothetical protein